MTANQARTAPALLVLFATVAFGVAPGMAQEHPAGPAEHKNALGVIIGATVESAEHETFFTFGLEYERELGHRWAFLAIAEHVSDFDAWVFVTPVAFKPVGGLSLIAGPGLETAPRRPNVHGEEEGGAFFLWRFGIGYTFNFGERFAVVPNIDLDLVREDGDWVEAWVFGVTLGLRF